MATITETKSKTTKTAASNAKAAPAKEVEVKEKELIELYNAADINAQQAAIAVLKEKVNITAINF